MIDVENGHLNFVGHCMASVAEKQKNPDVGLLHDCWGHCKSQPDLKMIQCVKDGHDQQKGVDGHDGTENRTDW